MVACETNYSSIRTCTTENSKLFYFFRLREVVPREAYLTALKAVSPKDGEVIFGGFGVYLLGLREIGVHDIDIATDSPRCVGRCVEQEDGIAVSEVDKIAVKMYSWNRTLLEREDSVPVDLSFGRVRAASIESAIAWWIQRTLSFLNSPNKGEELRAYKSLAELAYMWLASSKDVDKVARYIHKYSATVEGYSRFPQAVQGILDGACFLFYDHFGSSVGACKDAIREIAGLF
jgi:hypothetical protein